MSPVSRISRKIEEKLWDSKTNIKWTIEIKEDNMSSAAGYDGGGRGPAHYLNEAVKGVT